MWGYQWLGPRSKSKAELHTHVEHFPLMSSLMPSEQLAKEHLT
jgi:hypothetical protein